MLGVGASLGRTSNATPGSHAEPAAPAHQIYSGVLYDALGYKTLTPTQRRKADDIGPGGFRALGRHPLR